MGHFIRTLKVYLTDITSSVLVDNPTDTVQMIHLFTR